MNGLVGNGMTFTIGRGNDIVRAVCLVLLLVSLSILGLCSY